MTKVNKTIGVINYGYGNIYSVINALEHLKLDYEIINKSKEVLEFNNIILPGVGSFGNVMNKLNEMKYSDAIRKYVEDKENLLLGICVGMQAMFEGSEESENIEGLGIFDGVVKKLENNKDNYLDRVPNIGWRKNFVDKENAFLEEYLNEIETYFIHSYYCVPEKYQLH